MTRRVMESIFREWAGLGGLARVGLVERLGRLTEWHAGVEVVFEWVGDTEPVRWWFDKPDGSRVRGEIG